MPSPEDRRYLDTHEWHKIDGGVATIGISQFAVDELTDITYLEISTTSGPIKAGQSFGEIESVKATSDLYSGLDGQVIEVNQNVLDSPEIINDDPYDRGWMIKVRLTNPAQADDLMRGGEYDSKYGQ